MRTLALTFAALLLPACGKADPEAVNGAKSIGGAAGAVPRVNGVVTDNKHNEGAYRVTDIKGETQLKVKEDAVVAPRDAASGLPTGKRQHKPFVVTKPQ